MLVVIIHPWTKKITSNYFFWFFISIALLTYLICFRFYNDWVIYSQKASSGQLDNVSNNPNQSLCVSKAFLLDLCPFFALAIPISLIFDPTRTIAKYCAPVTLLGAAVTVFGQFPFEPNAHFTFDYIFRGDAPDTLYFSMHWFSLLLCTLVLLNSSKFTKKDVFWTFYVAIAFLIYVCIVIGATGAYANITGLGSYDWIYGEYFHVNEILGNIGYPWVAIIAYSAAILGMLLIIYIHNLTKKTDYYMPYLKTTAKQIMLN